MREEEKSHKLIGDRFETALKRVSLTVKSEVGLGKGGKKIDFVIYRKGYPLAVIEVELNVNRGRIRKSAAIEFVKSSLEKLNVRFGIVTDGDKFHLIDRYKVEERENLGFHEVIQLLIQWSEENQSLIVKSTHDVEQIIKEVVKKRLPKNSQLTELVVGILSRGGIKFDPDRNAFGFVDNGTLNCIENEFFMKLIGEVEVKKFCRYTSLSSLFEMLDTVSFRMSGIVGMNDKSEVDYAETYLGGINTTVHYTKVQAWNRRYITSGATIDRKDDLMFWRLYGDDAKGVCLVFDVIAENITKNVFLRKVNYAEGKDKHVELDVIRDIVNRVRVQTGFDFKFGKLQYWKHFFKPHDYSIEDEIRLLIVDVDDGSPAQIKSGWLLTNTHSILMPTLDFRLNHISFPIRLSEIILGPKTAEKDLNLLQLRELIRQQREHCNSAAFSCDLSNLKVSMSRIDHYR